MDEKVDRILSESLKLFKKYGIRSISMDDLAKELGMSKKTIYQYVANKTELVEMVLNYMLEKESFLCLDKENEEMNLENLINLEDDFEFNNFEDILANFGIDHSKNCKNEIKIEECEEEEEDNQEENDFENKDFIDDFNGYHYNE